MNKEKLPLCHCVQGQYFLWLHGFVQLFCFYLI